MNNHASHFQEARGPTLMQINVEGITTAKREVIQHLIQKHRAVGILLQETHSTKDEQLQIPGFNIIAAMHHLKHGIVTYARWMDRMESSQYRSAPIHYNGLLRLSTE